jgi:small subunit ribosomal protein S27e
MKLNQNKPKSKFIKVNCSKCKNDQVIFGKPSSKVICNTCGKILAEPSSGKGAIKARILEVLN